jgi:hypothetical protein
MRDLEEQTRELLKPLIEGSLNLLSISDDERVELAKWATKTAFVISHAAPLQKVPRRIVLLRPRSRGITFRLRKLKYGQFSVLGFGAAFGVPYY